MSSLWDSIKSNYSNAASYMFGGPGTWNGAMAAAENFGGVFSNIDAARATEAANARSAADQERQIALQREFAQNGIRWRVEDAKKAGLHPLAALGATGANYTPVTATYSDPGNPFADSARQMGQNLSRSIMATRTQEERKMTALQLENQQLQNDYLRSQIAMNNSAQVGPGLPGTRVVPSEQTATAPGRPSQQAGKVADVSYAQTKSGLVPVPSKDVKERIEDNLIQETMWSLRNNLAPNFGGGDAPHRNLLPSGYDYWKWNHWQQEYQPAKYPKGVHYRSDDY